MSNERGDLRLTYNGEIYNYQALTEQLREKGHCFRSRSDTEVLLHLYEEFGVEMLSHLNGIFAFAMWDARTRTLFLARDQMGVKPLYYAQPPAGFLFASEMKALLQSREVERKIDPVAVDQHLAFLWAVAPRTILKGVNKLEPGHALLVRDGRVTRKWEYYDLAYGGETPGGSEADLAVELSGHLEAAVNRQMVSDVPVGAFLSGGLDSSAVVAMMRRARPEYRLPCYSIGFGDDRDTEGSPPDLPYAKRVASALGVDLRPIVVDPSIIGNLERMLYHLDEPQADPAPINIMLISERARADGIKVLLSGAGGDDIFSGYRRHQALLLERAWGWLPRPARRGLSWLAALPVPGGTLARRMRRAFAFADLPPEERLVSYFLWSSEAVRRRLYGPGIAVEASQADALAPLRATLRRVPAETNRLNQMLYVEQRHFLADHNLNYTDKTGMAHGVEIRVPLLDLELVQFAKRVPPSLKQRGTVGKYIFKRAMEPYLPREVIYRPKTGFGAPLRRWLKNELTEMVDDVLSESAIRRRGLFEPRPVRQLIERDRSGRIDAAYPVFAILCLELWSQMFLDRGNVDAPAGRRSSGW